MRWLVDIWAHEPVLITGIVDAVCVLAVSFGMTIAKEQIVAIDALIVAIGLLIARSQVSSPATVAKIVDLIPGGQASIDAHEALKP